MAEETGAPNRVWISWSLGDRYKNNVSLFIGGGGTEEFSRNLAELFGSGLADQVLGAWSETASDQLPGTQVTHDEAVKNLRNGGLIGDEPQHGENRRCEHGDMIPRSGTSQKTGKPWSAWFCPLEKGNPAQCKPVFR